MDGVLLIDKPAGETSHDVVAAVRRELGGQAGPEGRPRRHARPVRDRPAARPRRPRHAGAALLHGAAEDVRDRRAVRRGLDDRRPRRRDHRDRRADPRPARAADRDDHASARRPTARSRSAGSGPTSSRGRGEEVELPEREVVVHAFEELWRDGDRVRSRIECSSGHLRALARRRPRRRLLRGAAPHGDRAVRRRRRRSGAPAAARRRARAGDAGRAARGRRRPAARPTGVAVEAEAPTAVVAARRRRRPDRGRRAAGGRPQLKPTVGFRVRMKVTHLPDAEPRPRRVAVGTFDGVHLGHREVIRGADTVLTFDPHPQSVVAPGSAPRLLTTFERKAELVARPRRRGARRHPVRRGVRRALGPGLRRPRARRDAPGHARLGGRELPLRPQGPGRRGDAARRRPLRDPRAAAARVPRRGRLLEPHPRPGPRRRRRGGRPAARRPVPGARRGRPRRQARAHARLPDREPRARRALRHARATASTPAGRRSSAPTPTLVLAGRGEHRRPAAVRHRPRRADRGLPARLRGRHLRQELRIDFLQRLRGEKRFDSVDALVEQMGRDVDEARAIAEASRPLLPSSVA